MKLNRLQTIMIITRNMALEENSIERSLMAIQIIDLLKEEMIEDGIKSLKQNKDLYNENLVDQALNK